VIEAWRAVLRPASQGLALAIAAAAWLPLALTVGPTVACEDRPTCYEGDHVACTCRGSGGKEGFAACAPNGEYGACVCDGTIPGVDASASRDAGDASDAGDAGDAEVGP